MANIAELPIRIGLFVPKNVIPQTRLEQAREEANLRRLTSLKITFQNILEDTTGGLTNEEGIPIAVKKPPIEMFGRDWLHWATLPDISKGKIIVRKGLTVFSITDEIGHAATFKLEGYKLKFQESTLVRPISSYKSKVERDISRLEFALMLLGFIFVDDKTPLQSAG